MNVFHCPLFYGIEEKDKKALLSCLLTKEKSYTKGETILYENDTTEYIGLVLSGMVIIEHSDVWGNNSILGSVTPGSVFAEAYACLPNEPLQISVIAAENTRILFLNVKKILHTCPNSCEFHMRLIQNLLIICANKNLGLSRRILHTTSKSIRGRLKSFFSEYIQKTGRYSFEIPYNRQQLADYLGVNRSAMCNELSKMQKEGLLQYEKKTFTIKKDIN